jgi:hypothetical protein
MASKSTPSRSSAARSGSSQPEIRDRVAQQPPDQELEAEIVDALGLRAVGVPRRRHPAVDGAVAHDQDRRLEPVVLVGDLGVLADPVGQALDDLAREIVRLGGARRRPQRAQCLVHIPVLNSWPQETPRPV